MATVKQIKDGTEMPKPIYVEKPYIVIGKKERVVLHAGTIESIKVISSYYDDCNVEVRAYDLHLNDNTKISEDRTKNQGTIIVKMRALLANADRRLDCLVRYYEEETDLEDTVNLDDGALASAWREQYHNLLRELDATKNR
jgi:hypothetical protein